MAQELWDGVQRAQQEAAAYREVFAKPEEARAAAERARTLEEIDAAFREMVFAGLRALEETGRQGSREAGAAEKSAVTVTAEGRGQTDAGLKPGAAQSAQSQHHANQGEVAAYREFEKNANEELEKSVGGAIRRTIEAALPNVKGNESGLIGGARTAVPLQERLAGAIREGVEAALKGDRQLGEQVAQILASRRFDDTTRVQVVRLINERAQQLVPPAAKRVINEWTQTTLTAHRAKTQRAEAGASRADLAPSQGVRSGEQRTQRSNESADSSATRAGRVDYRKLSDEQILGL